MEKGREQKETSPGLKREREGERKEMEKEWEKKGRRREMKEMRIE